MSLPGTKRGRTRDQLLAAAQLLLLESTAASLNIRQIATRAGMAHATFYNYYASIDALLDDLALLFLATHGGLVQNVRGTERDPAKLFSVTTRQSLRFVLAPKGRPGFARLLFDSGLPVDRFVTGLRQPLKADIADGIARGLFKVSDAGLIASLIAGAMMGLSLDLHRGTLKPAAIEPATQMLLEGLGVPRIRAKAIAHVPMQFVTAPALPIGWQDIGQNTEVQKP